MTGCRNTSEGFKCTNTKYIDGMCAGDKNPGVKSVYNAISKSMAAHNTVPSFAAVLASKAPTHTMEYKDGKYQITLTDSMTLKMLPSSNVSPLLIRVMGSCSIV